MTTMPDDDVIEKTAVALAGLHIGPPWNDLTPGMRQLFRRDARALAATGLLALDAAATRKDAIPLTEDQRWQWRASLIADLTGMDDAWFEFDSSTDRAYLEMIADGLLEVGWRFGGVPKKAAPPTLAETRTAGWVCGPVEQPDRDEVASTLRDASDTHKTTSGLRWSQHMADALLARYDIRERGETA